ncbi:hypothetical protein [Tellurirhabdus bombi]|uniref:hypothetical protein n=1 Tax=Tellurirhabdus bombi TaxID=2907205 RepID=UPI001F3173D6|nr:hypothetical protein [Tellurirhabdus bombi]
MQRQNALLSIFLFCFIILSCDSSPISGVYGGVKLKMSSWVGGGMERDDVVLYLRPDGTFTDDLSDPNWKTTVKGKYTVKGKEVIFTETKGDKMTYEITSKGYLSGGNHILLPLKMKGTLPALSLKYTGGSSSGGIGTNLPYIGTFSQNKLYIDGKGNFSHSRNSTVSITGDNIGGGTNSNKEDAGTYTYQDGLLTLKYNTGKSQTQSFFFTKDGEEIAALNGSIYTKDKDEDSKKATAKPAKVPTASELITKAKAAHGGKALDDIRTLKVISQTKGLLLLNQSDYQRPRTLAEVRAAGKLVFTEYWDGQQGWAWVQGKKNPLPQERIRDKEANRYAGFSGLHAQRIATLQKADVEALDNGGYELSYTQDGARLKMILNSKYQVVGEEVPSDGKTLKVTYSDFRSVKGVLLPFREKQINGSQKIEVKVTDYFINELEEKDWAEPSPR